jgi:hypothetical protein
MPASRPAKSTGPLVVPVNRDSGRGFGSRRLKDREDGLAFGLRGTARAVADHVSAGQ